MAKKKRLKQNNPVAKYAVQFHQAKVFRDRTKYQRMNKGALRKSLLPFLLGMQNCIMAVRSISDNDENKVLAECRYA